MALCTPAPATAQLNFADWGQDGSPVNPCGDPSAEGGALRSQDLRTSGDPVTLDGTVIRVDPARVRRTAATPLPMPPTSTNAASSPPACAIRSGSRPGQEPTKSGLVSRLERLGRDQCHPEWHRAKGELRVALLRRSHPQGAYATLNICANLGSGDVTQPFFAYRHSDRVVPNETCPTGSSSVAGVEFEFAAVQNFYPAEYDEALFFADYSRDCIWVMPKGADGKLAPRCRRGRRHRRPAAPQAWKSSSSIFHSGFPSLS